MPSGAKKRKAAKKKMGNNEPNSTTLSRGDDPERNVGEIREYDNKAGKTETNGGSSESSSNGNSDNESRVLNNGQAVSNNDDSLSVALDRDNHSSVEEEFDTSSSTDKYVPSYVTDSVLNDKVSNSAASDRKVDGKVIQSVKNSAVILDPEERLLPEKNNNSTLSPGSAEHVKDSGVTEPLLNPSIQHVEKKTSWKGCCGLFEVFMGSGN